MKNYILGTKQLPKATVEKFDKADMAYYNKIMANEPIAEKSFSVQELDFFFLKYLHKKYPENAEIKSIFDRLSTDQNNSFDGFNTPQDTGKQKSLKKALKEIEKAPSVKYWMEPEFKAESRKYPQTGEPNSFIQSDHSGTLSGGGRWRSKDIVAYDENGAIVGVFSMAVEGRETGAFKITVREDAKRKGWGSKLLNEAERIGIDVVGNIGKNSFSSSGRDLLRSWLQKKDKVKFSSGGSFDQIANLPKLLRTDQALEIIDSDEELSGSDWTAGACYPLAIALQQLYGGELVVIKADGIVQHVMVQIGDNYLDADGLQTAKEKFKNFERDSHRLYNEWAGKPIIAPYRAAECKNLGKGSEQTIEKIKSFIGSKKKNSIIERSKRIPADVKEMVERSMSKTPELARGGQADQDFYSPLEAGNEADLGVHQSSIQHSITITPELKASVYEGLPLFARGGKIADAVLAVLRQGTLDGRKYTLPQQLSREDYVQANKAITGMGGKWNRSAQAHIFESEDSAAAFFKQISDSNTYKNLKQEFQFFPTPAALATKMVELARLKSGDVILEPSAGRGSIIDAILKKAKDDGLSNLKIYGIELMPDNYRVLFEKHKQSEIHIESGDFLTYYTGAKEDLFKGAKILWEGEERAVKNTTRVGNENKYEIELDNGKSIWTDENTIRRPLPKFDKIIMNPPFSGGQDIKHLLHAWTMLKPGGVLVAIVSDSAMKNSYARNKEFAAFLEENKATVEPLKQDTFKESGTPIATNLIVLEKSEVPADNESELDQLKKSLLKADKGYQRKAAEDVIAWMQAGRNPNDKQNTKIVADAVHSRVKELQSLVDSVNADGELMQDEMIRDLIEEYNTFKRILELYEKWINEPQFPNGKELLDLTVKEIVWAYEDLVSKTEKLTQVAREKRKVLKAKLSSAKGELKKKLKEELDAVVAEIEFVERDFIELKYLQSFGSLFEYLSADLIKEGIDEEEIREMIIPEMYSAISDEASREHYWDMLYEDVWKDVVAIYKAEKEGIPLTYSKEANMHIPVCVSALVNYVLKTKKHPQAKLVAAGYLTDQPEDILPAWSVVFGDLDMSEDQIKAVFDCRCKVYIADDKHGKVLHHFILPYDIGPNQPAIAEQYFDKVLIALSQSPAEFLEYEAKLIFVLDLLKR